MSPKILRRCDVCKGFHTSYLVADASSGNRYLCYKCWKALYGAQPTPGSDRQEPGPAADVPPPRRGE
jgi:hypothetical protein